jgi:hypothetical protein
LRRTEYVIKIYLKPNDKKRIAQEAREAGMSMSAYARTLALGEKSVASAELTGIADVMKVHADIGRLGGLLKMTLTNDERLNDIGRDMGVATIDNTLVDIRATQAKLLELTDAVLKKTTGRR